MAKLTAGEIILLTDLHSQGWEIKRIARELDRSPTAVRYQVKKLELQAAQAVQPDLPPETPDHTDTVESDDAVDADIPLERSAKGRTVLWNILHDPSSPPQSRVQAFNTLAESERWGLDDDMQRRLPAPLTRTELVGRQTDLLKSLSLPILEQVLRDLSAWLVVQRSPLQVTVAMTAVASSQSSQPSPTPDAPQSR